MPQIRGTSTVSREEAYANAQAMAAAQLNNPALKIEIVGVEEDADGLFHVVIHAEPAVAEEAREEEGEGENEGRRQALEERRQSEEVSRENAYQWVYAHHVGTYEPDPGEVYDKSRQIIEEATPDTIDYTTGTAGEEAPEGESQFDLVYEAPADLKPERDVSRVTAGPEDIAAADVGVHPYYEGWPDSVEEAERRRERERAGPMAHEAQPHFTPE